MDLFYKSSAPELISVDENGLLTGLAQKGNATITVSVLSESSQTPVKTLQCEAVINNGYYQNLIGEEQFIKWHGRKFFYRNAVNCFNTASGFEITFYGTSLTAEITSAGGETLQLCVLTDGETDTVSEENILSLSQTKLKQAYTLAEGLELGVHTVRVLKISEAYFTSVAYHSIQTDGYFYARPSDKDLKIEVYGDSISVGKGNARPNVFDESDTDKKTNDCATYAWYAAQDLNAEVRVQARTAIGMNFSWGSTYTMSNAWDDTY